MFVVCFSATTADTDRHPEEVEKLVAVATFTISTFFSIILGSGVRDPCYSHQCTRVRTPANPR